MTGKPDFSQINTGIGQRVLIDVEQATGKRRQQGSADKEEAAQRRADGRTQGRKGCKAQRMSIAFTTDNYQYTKVTAAATGKTASQFINMLIDEHRKTHPATLEMARELLSALNTADNAEPQAADPEQAGADQE